MWSVAVLEGGSVRLLSGVLTPSSAPVAVSFSAPFSPTREGGEEPKASDNLTLPHPTSTRLDEVRRGSQMSHVDIEPG